MIRKSQVAKLSKLRASVERHEEAIEQNFSPKTVAIIKTRLGMEGGDMMYAKEVAKVLKVSESWVNKVQKEITDFCKEMDKKTPKLRRPHVSQNKQGDIRVGAKAPKEPQMFCKGTIDPKTGIVTVEAVSPEANEAMRVGLTQILTHARKNFVDAKAAEEAYAIGKKASDKFFFAFMAAVVSAAGIAIGIHMGDNLIPYAVAAVSAIVGLGKYHSGVSLSGVRHGLLKVREF